MASQSSQPPRESYVDAATRLCQDGRFLYDTDDLRRYANADHLFGLAAECALKALQEAALARQPLSRPRGPAPCPFCHKTPLRPLDPGQRGELTCPCCHENRNINVRPVNDRPVAVRRAHINELEREYFDEFVASLQGREMAAYLSAGERILRAFSDWQPEHRYFEDGFFATEPFRETIRKTHHDAASEALALLERARLAGDVP